MLSRQRALIKQLHNAVTNYNKCSKKKRTLTYLQARLEALEKLHSDILELHTSIFESPEIEVDEYIESDEFELVEEAYFSLKSVLRDGIIALQPPIAQTIQINPAAQPVGNNVVPVNDFRLPTISIPSFSGEYTSWPSFKNSFDHLVATNQTLSNLQRLHFLKNSLTGDARKLIQHYDLAEANYQAAWDKLKQRYDNKNLLISSHLKNLIHHPAQIKESASHLRSLIDSVTDSLNGLRTLGVDTVGWDPIIIYLLIEKVSKDTHSIWQSTQMTNELPTLVDFTAFLENRFRTLEAIADKPSSSHTNPFDVAPNAKPRSRSVNKQANSFTASLQSDCILCHQKHYLRACASFLRMDPKERFETAHQLKVCINCLVPGHSVNQCRNKSNCTVCDKRHHTLLHFQKNQNAPSSSNIHQQHNSNILTSTRASTSSQDSASLALMSTPISNPVLLATACVNVIGRFGQILPLRALIDPGSQVSFITTKAIQRLQLKPTPTSAKIFGIGQTYSGTSTKAVSLSFQSTLDAAVKIESDFLTIQQITGALPPTSYNHTRWPHLQNLHLADPSYYKSGPIDLLLSAEIYGRILLPGIQRGNVNEPIAQNTTIGWILLGGSSNPTTNTNLSLHSLVDIDSRLRSFWESEEVSTNSKLFSSEDAESDSQYRATHSRDQNGRFVVRLPFKTDAPITLGSSRDNAIQRLLQIEKKFLRDPQLGEDYKLFMKQYLDLGHMKQVDKVSSAYYIPHHPVIKASSTTTKLRVVFDASHKSSSGTSLNDHLIVGPTIQDSLTALITRWRKYPIAFTADLEKMYRQILINKLDQSFQRIVWRDSPKDEIQDFQLLTVTYGTACAQYLAIRSLHQLAEDGGQSHPLAAKRLLEDFYVDDLLSGAYDVSEALQIQHELRELCSTAGLNLRKWASNHDALLQAVPPCDREIKTTLLIEFDDTIKSLGINWDPRSDNFLFQSTLHSSTASITKRSILSEISKLFDPLGWLSPIIIRAKILMQQMWILDKGWDDELPSSVLNQWSQLRKDFEQVHIFSFSRSINHSPNATIELHGFSDASIHAYAAVVYSRIVQDDHTYTISLIAAKSKVAPIKQVTLPRLELCGAHLLTKLLRKIQADLNNANTTSFAWCDSTIVLQWLQGHPNRLKTYVANRVSDILEYGDIKRWRHVSSKDNPADCVTRGLDATSLKTHSLWWNGPAWLRLNESHWPISVPLATKTVPELKAVSLTSTTEEHPFELFVSRYSSITRLTRIVAHLKRFIHNARVPKERKSGPLTPLELDNSLLNIIHHVQSHCFAKEFENLQGKRNLHHRSQLLSLDPFIDEHQIIRVGGRLQNANMSFRTKHPIILPKAHHLTKLLIIQTHLNTLHGGPELVTTLLRKRYWIMSLRSAIRQQLFQCLRCFRFKAKRCTQLMGSLPKPRVQIDRPFTHTGVDCAGPINLRMSKGRGAKSYKGYIVLFVCLCSKAVHIEAVSDMTTPAFIAAYRRFCSRRGFPHHMYSDNGTNFVGASRVIRKEASSQLLHISQDIVDDLANNGSTWHFIPPAAPHFGGLWEAGIKSMKHHLKKIIGDSTLTFEEISTLLTQIEACLNSRPLCPTTSDPSDTSALTPGHFLIGDALLAPPESSFQTLHTNPNTRWQLVQKLKFDFWKRWQKEYLIRLQNRPKWAIKSTNIEINDLVLIIEDNLPPSRWALGRVFKTHPGADGCIRVVTLKCKNGMVKRPLAKLALLPAIN